MEQLTATLHDGSAIDVVVSGDGPAVVLPVRATPHEEETAVVMRAWGADPEAGPTLIDGLTRAGFRVIAADIEAHRMTHPAPLTLTAATMTSDLLSVADASGATTFAYAGYSWLALCGFQLATSTDRLWALAMGGFPPIDGPHAEMLAVTMAAHAASAAPDLPSSASEPGDWDSASIQTTEAQTRQFVTLYEGLADFDDRRAALAIGIPALAYAGERDEIVYSERWGGVTVRMARPLIDHRNELDAAGWTVRVLPGLDHIGAMRGEVALPLLRDWLLQVRS